MTPFDQKRAKVSMCGKARRMPARHRDVRAMLDSLVSRLDVVQRRAFYEKMMQLDTARARVGSAKAIDRDDRPALDPLSRRASDWLC